MSLGGRRGVASALAAVMVLVPASSALGANRDGAERELVCEVSWRKYDR